MAVSKSSDRDPAQGAGSGALGEAARAMRDHERSRAIDERSRRDHEAINRLADDLLPALIARLSGSGLGEIEVREGSWKARLRKPVSSEKRAAARVEHVGHAAAITRSAPSHREDRHAADTVSDEEPGVVIARSPAVGVYTPRRDLVVGMHVRSGDRIGSVDVLGVQQDVLSPIEGVIGSSLAEAGEAVEYGQELVRIELPERAGAADRPAPEQKATAGVAGRS